MRFQHTYTVKSSGVSFTTDGIDYPSMAAALRSGRSFGHAFDLDWQWTLPVVREPGAPSDPTFWLDDATVPARTLADVVGVLLDIVDGTNGPSRGDACEALNALRDAVGSAAYRAIVDTVPDTL